MRHLFLKMLLLVSLLPLIAIAREPGEQPDRPGDFHQPRCDRNGLDVCYARCSDAATTARRLISALEPRLQALSSEMSALNESRAAHERKLEQTQSEISVLTKEINFTRGFMNKNTAPLLPGFPSLEDFFRLHPLQKNWLDRFPTERGQKLTTRLHEAKGEEGDLSARRAKIMGEFQALNSEYQSVSQQKTNLLAQASEHENACPKTCRELSSTLGS